MLSGRVFGVLVFLAFRVYVAEKVREFALIYPRAGSFTVAFIITLSILFVEA